MSLVVISCLLLFLIFLISIQRGCMLKDSLSCGIFRHSNTTAWFQPSTLLYGPSFLGLLLQWRLSSALASPDLYKWQNPASLSDILCLQNQYHLGDLYTFPSSPAITMCTLGLLWTTASVCWPLGNASQKISPQCFQFPLNHNWFFSPH